MEKFWWVGALVAALAGVAVVASAIMWTDQGWVSGNEQPTDEWRDRVTHGRREGLRQMKTKFPGAVCQKSWFLKADAGVVLARSGPPEKNPDGEWSLALYDFENRRRSVFFDEGVGAGKKLFGKVERVYPGEVHGWVLALELEEDEGEWHAKILSASPWWDEVEQFQVICDGVRP